MLVEAGCDAFAEARFFVAHELWEVAWLGTKAGAEGFASPLAEGLRGLVQWTTAAHHLQRATGDARLRLAAAAERVLARGLARLGQAQVRAALVDPVAGPLLSLPTGPEPGELLEPQPDLVPRRLPLDAIGLLLGGGHGRRAGGPKALKLLEGEPLWRHQARRTQAAGCAQVVAVLHPDAFPAATDQPEPGVLAIESDPDAAPFASLQRALAAIAADRAVLLLPVDCPCPPRAVAVALLAATLEARLRATPWSAARPVVRCVPDLPPRAGHPVLLSPAFRTQLSDANPETARLDHLLASLAAPCRLDVEVRSTAILANFNRDGLSS